jgi:hypothetical protein
MKISAFLQRFPALLPGSLLALVLFGLANPAIAQTVAVTADPPAAVGTAAPVVAWVTTPPATSCTAQGAWSGAKPSAGVENQAAIATTSTFDLTCAFPGSPATNGSALVAWDAPVTRTDGTPYTNPGSYRIDYGLTPEMLNAVYVDRPDARWHRIDDLAHGLWYFAVRAVDAQGFESPRSNTATYLVGTAATPASTASGSATVTITAAPALRVVPVHTDLDHSPVYRMTLAGKRDARYADACGYIEVGTQCSGPVMFEFREKRFHRVNPEDVKAWGATCSGEVAAPCVMTQ